jgi:hypothetical protein
MPTPRTLHHDYPAPPEAVAGLLRDPTFLRQRCEAIGELNVEVTVEPVPQGLRVIVARDKEVALPSFAKRMFSPKNRIVDDTCWHQEGERWVADYRIEFAGIPGEVRGRSTITPIPAGCRYESSFEVTARVPLVGGKLESFVADRVEETFRAHAARTTAQLAS